MTLESFPKLAHTELLRGSSTGLTTTFAALIYDAAYYSWGPTLWTIAQPSRLVAPFEGVYHVAACIGNVSPAATVTMYFRITRGPQRPGAIDFISLHKGANDCAIASVVWLAAGEYVEVMANSSVTTTIPASALGTTMYWNWASMTPVSVRGVGGT